MFRQIPNKGVTRAKRRRRKDGDFGGARAFRNWFQLSHTRTYLTRSRRFFGVPYLPQAPQNLPPALALRSSINSCLNRKKTYTRLASETKSHTRSPRWPQNGFVRRSYNRNDRRFFVSSCLSSKCAKRAWPKNERQCQWDTPYGTRAIKISTRPTISANESCRHNARIILNGAVKCAIQHDSRPVGLIGRHKWIDSRYVLCTQSLCTLQWDRVTQLSPRIVRRNVIIFV